MESLSQPDNKIEIILTYKNQTYPLFLEKDSSFQELRESIQSALGLPKKNYFEVYAGNYYINELFDEIPLEKVNESFKSNRYNVLYYNEKDPFSKFKADKNLEDFLKYHRDILQKYLEVKDVDSDLKDCYNDMLTLASNLEKVYENILNEGDYLKKQGLLSKHDHICLKLEKETKKKNEIEAYLDRGFKKILELKNSEKEAVDLIKENKNLVSLIHQNSRAIEKKKKLISNLKNHRMISIKF
jgi:hypothetical protein